MAFFPACPRDKSAVIDSRLGLSRGTTCSVRWPSPLPSPEDTCDAFPCAGNRTEDSRQHHHMDLQSSRRGNSNCTMSRAAHRLRSVQRGRAASFAGALREAIPVDYHEMRRWEQMLLCPALQWAVCVHLLICCASLPGSRIKTRGFVRSTCSTRAQSSRSAWLNGDQGQWHANAIE